MNNLFKASLYFYKLASIYDEQFKDQIEELSKQNPRPFKFWFSSGDREYIPFTRKDVEIDEPVKLFLKQHGYTITDYLKGYAEKNGRTYRIGKIFGLIKNQLIAELEAKLIEDKTEYNYRYNKIMATILFIENYFINSKYRKDAHTDQHLIVISQNPHDVAKMSTDRAWTSCMNLEKDKRQNDIFYEVSEGGLVAYIIKEDDLEIKKPLARIHIRRFTDLEGKSIAIPEKIIYGDDVPGFKEAVKKWLDEKQGQITPGAYFRCGSGWSDSFYKVHAISPQKEEELSGWLKGTILPPNWDMKLYEVTDKKYYLTLGYENLLPVLDRTRTFTSLEDAEKYLENVKNDKTVIEETKKNDWDVNDRFKIMQTQSTSLDALKKAALEEIGRAERGKYSQELIDLAYSILFKSKPYNGLNTQQSIFLEKYPEFITQEFVKGLSFDTIYQLIKLLPEEQTQTFLSDYIKTIEIKKILLSDDATAIRHPIQLIYLFKQIPNDILNIVLLATETLIKENDAGGLIYIVKLLGDKNIIRPEVTQLYNIIIEDFWWHNGLRYVVGEAIAKLGKEGIEFIPKLEEMLKSAEEKLELAKPIIKDQMELKTYYTKIRNIKYIIDSILNGTGHSTQYRYIREGG